MLSLLQFFFENVELLLKVGNIGSKDIHVALDGMNVVLALINLPGDKRKVVELTSHIFLC